MPIAEFERNNTKIKQLGLRPRWLYKLLLDPFLELYDTRHGIYKSYSYLLYFHAFYTYYRLQPIYIIVQSDYFLNSYLHLLL